MKKVLMVLAVALSLGFGVVGCKTTETKAEKKTDAQKTSEKCDKASKKADKKAAKCDKEAKKCEKKAKKAEKKAKKCDKDAAKADKCSSTNATDKVAPAK